MDNLPVAAFRGMRQQSVGIDRQNRFIILNRNNGNAPFRAANTGTPPRAFAGTINADSMSTVIADERTCMGHRMHGGRSA